MDALEIQEMTTGDDVAIVRGMLRSYVQWLFDTFPDQTEDLGAYYSPERLQQALDEVGTDFVSPKGLALIARLSGSAVGCVLAHPIAPGVAEMKRLFVMPAARGRGVGHELVSTLKDRLAASGYPTVRLDTAIFLTDAISLYRRMGFVEIEPYTALPPGTARTAMFMEWRP
jgi:ribosomal protein S18 acetylase RimI-like enzyme